MRQSRGTMKLITSLLFVLAVVSTAQEAPKKDPFIKDKKPAVAPQPTEQVANVTFLLETFSVPQADFAAWLEMPEGLDKLHAQVLAAVKAGKATLDGCHFASGKGGTRFTLESVDEVSYPSEWDAAGQNGLQYPVAFEMTQTGDRLEIEPTVDPSKSMLEVNHSFERVRFGGLRAQKADRTQPGAVVADFHEQRALSDASLVVRLPALVNAHGTGSGQMSLTFLTPRLQPVVRPARAEQRGAGNIVLTPRVISLERVRAWELLRQHAEDSTALLTALKPMLTDGTAVLEHLSMLRGKPGVRTKSEAVKKHFYGTEFDPPAAARAAEPSDDPKKSGKQARPATQAGTTSFDCRPIGFTWESESVLSPDGAIIDVNIMFERTTFAGNLADPLWNEHYPDYPVFACQKITTGVALAAGSTHLLSTLNPPGDTGVNGRKDEGRVWLLFLEATLE